LSDATSPDVAAFRRRRSIVAIPFIQKIIGQKNSVRLLKLFTIYLTSTYNQKYSVLFTSIWS
jgi:hypothetical protein